MRRTIIAIVSAIVLTQPASALAYRLPQVTNAVSTCGPTEAVSPSATTFQDGMLHAVYCIKSTDAVIPIRWAHHLWVDGGLTAYTLTGVICQFDAVNSQVACNGVVPDPAAAIFRDGNLHAIQISFNDGTESARGMAAAFTTAAAYSGPAQGCVYIPPGGGALSIRPVGQTMQGYNAIGPSGTDTGQGKRIYDLRRWGWLTDWSFDATNQKVVLFVSCAGREQ
jgi:hypothetical protein